MITSILSPVERLEAQDGITSLFEKDYANLTVRLGFMLPTGEKYWTEPIYAYELLNRHLEYFAALDGEQNNEAINESGVNNNGNSN